MLFLLSSLACLMSSRSALTAVIFDRLLFASILLACRARATFFFTVDIAVLEDAKTQINSNSKFKRFEISPCTCILCTFARHVKR